MLVWVHTGSVDISCFYLPITQFPLLITTSWLSFMEPNVSILIPCKNGWAPFYCLLPTTPGLSVITQPNEHIPCHHDWFRGSTRVNLVHWASFLAFSWNNREEDKPLSLGLTCWGMWSWCCPRPLCREGLGESEAKAWGACAEIKHERERQRQREAQKAKAQ